jgi:16S rRNA processing protein RimM
VPAPTAPGREGWLPAGRVGRPHGLDGSFHVTRPRPALLPLGGAVRVADADREVVRRAGTDERPILRLSGIDGRAAVEALRGADLWVAREGAPPLGEDEWYADDLVGLRVVDGRRPVGEVGRLVPLPSCEALEVRSGGEPLLVPLVRDCVRSVDLPGGVVDIDLGFLGDTLPRELAAGGEPQAVAEPEAAGGEPRDARGEPA